MKVICLVALAVGACSASGVDRQVLVANLGKARRLAELPPALTCTCPVKRRALDELSDLAKENLKAMERDVETAENPTMAWYRGLERFCNSSKDFLSGAAEKYPLESHKVTTIKGRKALARIEELHSFINHSLSLVMETALETALEGVVTSVSPYCAPTALGHGRLFIRRAMADDSIRLRAMEEEIADAWKSASNTTTDRFQMFTTLAQAPLLFICDPIFEAPWYQFNADQIAQMWCGSYQNNVGTS